MRQPNGLILPINICAMISEKRLMKNKLIMKNGCPICGHPFFVHFAQKNQKKIAEKKRAVLQCAQSIILLRIYRMWAFIRMRSFI